MVTKIVLFIKRETKIMITVFTPTYNRAYILPQLYQSLCAQSNKEFEWLVVDDGSTDDTEKIISDWILEKKININYIYQENSGKSNAIKIGVNNAKGEIFFIVDSDDYITNDALEKIDEANKYEHERVSEFPLAGFCFRKENYKTGMKLGKNVNIGIKYADSLELAFGYHLNVDKAEVFYTNVLKQFPFPEIHNNKFIPEALIWYRIAAAGYKFAIYDDPIYMCDYIEDGYTNNFMTNLKKNNKGFYLFYSECLNYKIIPLRIKFIYLIRMLQCKLYGVIYK